MTIFIALDLKILKLQAVYFHSKIVDKGIDSLPQTQMF